jgi:hypothetical protein
MPLSSRRLHHWLAYMQHALYTRSEPRYVAGAQVCTKGIGDLLSSEIAPNHIELQEHLCEGTVCESVSNRCESGHIGGEIT